MNKSAKSYPQNSSSVSVILFTSLKAVIISMLITALALIILAAFVTYGPVSENTAGICVTVAMIISVFLSGFVVSKKMRRRGYLSGMIAGGIYILIMLATGFLAFGNLSIGASSLKTVALAIASGTVGGIFGVNFK